jgi:hypothetical protein
LPNALKGFVAGRRFERFALVGVVKDATEAEAKQGVAALVVAAKKQATAKSTNRSSTRRSSTKPTRPEAAEGASTAQMGEGEAA